MPQTRLANLSWLDLNDLIEDGVLGQIERVRNQGTDVDLAVDEDEIITLGVIPIAATALDGASLSWGMNF